MRLWNISDSKGKQATVRAWSARHAKFLGLALGITATKIVLIGRSNPDSQDGYRKRDSSRDNPDGFKSRPRSAKADDGWKAR